MVPDDVLGLAGRIALVTGSSAGIGAAVARHLGGRGMRVVVNSRSEERVRAAVASLDAEGIEVVGVAADVSTPDGAAAAVAAAHDAFGGLDVLVNNAGASLVTPTTSMSLEMWEDCLRTNLTGPFLCAQAAHPDLVSSEHAVIVNVGSIFSHAAGPNRAAYTAAKHGVQGLTKALALEWAADGIRVTGVDPGVVDTDLLRSNMASGGLTEASIGARVPLSRAALPAEVAHAVAYLASDHAAYITGSTLVMDGGWLANAGW